MTWEAAWQDGRTPWDAGQSAPVLHQLVADDALPTGRAFVPGAGSGYDILTLASAQRHVVGVDLSAVAQQRFEALVAEHPLRTRMEYLVTDAFSLAPEPRFDLHWDYTFLCALPIEMRPKWLEMVDRVLAPEGELAALIFPVIPDADPLDGPPFPISPELVTELVAPILEPVSIERVEQSHPGREGKEWLGRYRRRA